LTAGFDDGRPERANRDLGRQNSDPATPHSRPAYARLITLNAILLPRHPMATRYYLSIPDGERARGSDADLSFTAVSAEGFASQLQAALRGDALFERWRAKQPEPDEVDASLGATDPNATVQGEQRDLRMDLVAVTALSGTVLKHRLRLLAGSGWELRDVTAA
jgi:hypothetical protein